MFMTKILLKPILLLMFCLNLALAGCNRYYVAPATTTDRLLKEINQSTMGICSLKGVAKIQIQSSVGNYQLVQKIFYLAPDKIRLEILGIFGVPAIQVLIEGEQLQLFMPVRNVLVKGEASELGFAFAINDIVATFLNGAKLDLPAGALVSLEENRKFYQLSWVEAEGQCQEVLVDKKTKIIARQLVRRTRDRVIIRKIERSNFIKSGQYYYPKQVSIYDRDLKQKVTFLFSQLQLNLPLEPQVFQLKLPSQYEQKNLSDFLMDYPSP